MSAIDDKLTRVSKAITGIEGRLKSIDMQARGLRQMASYEPRQHTKAAVDMRLGFMVDFLGVAEEMFELLLRIICDQSKDWE